MKSFYYYFETKKRLVQMKETISMMGGDDGSETNYQLMAQKDMLELELKYHKQSMIYNSYGLLLAATICVILYYVYSKGLLHV